MSLKFLVLLMFIAQPVLAGTEKKYMTYMGGGSEPAGPTTIFDNNAAQVVNFIERSRTWIPTVSFNGGHENTDFILSKIESRGVKNNQFTNESFEAMISDYETKIKSGKIKAGDQILVMADTHGAANEAGLKSHKIATVAEKKIATIDISKYGLVSMDRLQSLITLAESKGVKLGIVDFSCHSGNTLALKGPNTCIIANTGSDNFGYAGSGTFSNRFGALMAEGKSLEQVFTEANSSVGYDIGFALISSPVGLDIQKELYNKVRNYIIDWTSDKHLDKLTPLLKLQVKKNECKTIDAEFESLTRLIEKMEAVANVEEWQPDFRELKNALDQYHELQSSIRNDLQTMANLPYHTKENLCAPPKAPGAVPVCLDYTPMEMLAIDYSATEERYRGYLTTYANDPKNPPETFHAWLNILAQAKTKKEAFLAAHPELTKYENYFKNYPGLQEKTSQYAKLIADESRSLQRKMYEERSKSDKRKNPCKNFKL